MEAIKNYLESMFGSLPNTPEVRKAKIVLGEMMEDKYMELLREGKSENEAVGTVISEFGNLDELAEELGIGEALAKESKVAYRKVTLEEVKGYFQAKAKQAYLVGFGVMLCILCVVPFFFGGVFWSVAYYSISTSLMFLMIAVAVVLFVISGVTIHRWKFLSHGACTIDYETAQYVEEKQDSFRMTFAVMLSIGILLCIICVIPVIVTNSMIGASIFLAEGIGLTCMFVMIATGVFLIIASSMRKAGYSHILHLNSSATMGGNYVESQNEEAFQNETLARYMSLYWPTVTCIYLCWSFLSFDWHITWITWVIAALVKQIIKVCDSSSK